MIDAALIGLGWWGKNILKAVQGRSGKLRFVHGVSKEIDQALPLAEEHGFKLSSELEAALGDPRVTAEVQTQFISTRPDPDPRDTISVMVRFESGVSGFLGAVRASPFYLRVHVFGDEGSAEALGETQLVLRSRGGKTEVRDFKPRDSLLAELEAYADAVAVRVPYPITPAEMVDTIGAFEAITQSIAKRAPVRVSDL